MRLITPFHDYYDGVVATSVNDKTFTFVRETREIKLKPDPRGSKYHYNNQKIPISEIWWRTEQLEIPTGIFFFHIGIIGFCGQLIPYIKVDDPGQSGIRIDKYLYTVSDIDREYPKLKDYQYKNYRSYGKSIYDRLVMWLNDVRISDTWKSHTDYKTNAFLTTLFEKENAAYYVIESGDKYSRVDSLKVYPRLQNYSFFRIYDSFSAFQKIEFYLTNELVRPDRPIIQPVPDKIKSESHGFDKWSFRKESSKK